MVENRESQRRISNHLLKDLIAVEGPIAVR